ncbi:MAG TPA: DMT family transporter [Acetobacteraceae bacterium]|nr:DMT family transporter [Acetobacteraceae bacterium]
MRAVARLRTDRQTAGNLLVLASTVAFAIGPTAARLAYDDGSNALTVVTLRGMIGAALMALLIQASGQGFGLDRRASRWCLCCGAFSALVVYGFIGSVAYVPVSVAVLVFFTHPILIATTAHWRGGDRLSAKKLFLAFGAFAGLALVLGPEFGALDRAGLALAALAAIAMCGMILCSVRAQERATSAQVNFYATAVSSAGFALLTTTLGAWALPSGMVGWLGIACAGVGVGIGLLAFFAALRHLSPVRATMLSNVEPLVSILFAAAILGERLEPPQWAGVALVIAALVLFEAVGRGEDRSGVARR